MITTRDPEAMTADERRQEVSTILAAGLLRRIRQAKSPAPQADPPSLMASRIDLDLSSETRLSVAQQPVG